ncbi:MAG: tetratricopeptide repeat protein [Alphaproteobacteria bacterium]|nr:MAG: tetratricopeptide repeat protein [Alphaproteobacteria bacterium]
MSLKIIGISLFLGVFFLAQPSHARQDDPRLDGLFTQLAEVKSDQDAKVIEGSIWKIWLTSGSDTVDFMMLQGMRYMSEGRFDKAIALFSTVIKIDPEFSEAWNKRATVLFLVGEFDRSIEDIGHTLELEPRHFGALAGLGQIYELQKQPEDAISAYEKAVAINPHMEGVKTHMKMLETERDKKNI